MSTYINATTFAPLVSEAATNARLLEVIAQASAWVDTLYSGIAPFASIGSGKRAQVRLAESVAYDGRTLTLAEGLPEALTAGDELQLENFTESAYDSAGDRAGIFSNFGGNYAGQADYSRQDYTVYRLASDHAEGATTLSLSSGVRVPLYTFHGGERHVVIGTPPTITAAAELYAIYLWQLPYNASGKDAGRSRKTEAESLLGVRNGKAYTSPHPLLWR